MNVLELTGQRFGKLTVIREHGRIWGNFISWLCRCDCGVELIRAGPHLKYQVKRGRVPTCLACQYAASTKPHKCRYCLRKTMQSNKHEKATECSSCEQARHRGHICPLCGDPTHSEKFLREHPEYAHVCGQPRKIAPLHLRSSTRRKANPSASSISSTVAQEKPEATGSVLNDGSEHKVAKKRRNAS